MPTLRALMANFDKKPKLNEAETLLYADYKIQVGAIQASKLKLANPKHQFDFAKNKLCLAKRAEDAANGEVNRLDGVVENGQQEIEAIQAKIDAAKVALPTARDDLVTKMREHVYAQTCLDDLAPKKVEQPPVQTAPTSTVPADQAPICPTAAVQALSFYLLTNQTGLDHLFGDVESGGRQHMNLFFGRIEQAIQINDTIKQRGSCEHVDYEGIVPLIETVRV